MCHVRPWRRCTRVKTSGRDPSAGALGLWAWVFPAHLVGRRPGTSPGKPSRRYHALPLMVEVWRGPLHSFDPQRYCPPWRWRRFPSPGGHASPRAQQLRPRPVLGPLSPPPSLSRAGKSRSGLFLVPLSPPSGASTSPTAREGAPLIHCAPPALDRRALPAGSAGPRETRRSRSFIMTNAAPPAAATAGRWSKRTWTAGLTPPRWAARRRSRR